MHCHECIDVGDQKLTRVTRAFIPDATIHVDDPRYRVLLTDCVKRIPKSGKPIMFGTVIRLKKSGPMPGVVGLTTYLVEGYSTEKSPSEVPGKHTVTFYTRLLNKLSDDAVVAVMAHEFAHAWLNEHVRPEASKQREEDADMLAEMWGFGPELQVLASETEPLYPS
jgi:Peptidase family M48